jgi:hypothetical protein
MPRRSWTYDLKRARQVGETAVRLGLAIRTPTGGYRDQATGRRITALLALVARLPIRWDSLWGWEWLASIWEPLCSSDRKTVRRWVWWLLDCAARRTYPSRRPPARLSY